MPNALTIILGAADITNSVDMTSVRMQLSGSADVAICEFDIVDPANAITATDEMHLTVTEVSSSTVLFGGFVRSRRISVAATGRLIHISAVDYNSLLDRAIVISDSRAAGKSDRARLIYLMTTYGPQFSSDYSQIATLNSSMVKQGFVALTLRQAIERVLGQASTLSAYYCDTTGRLVTYSRSSTTAAPYNLRVGTPGAGEIAPSGAFDFDNDASNLCNAVYIVGATAAGSGWFTDATSIATYGRRERFFNAPDSDTNAKATQVGLAVLEDQKNPVPRGSFTTESPHDGWRIGQSITVTSAQHGLSGVTYRIARVTVRYLNPAGAREYGIELGAPQPKLTTLLAAREGGGGGYPWHSPGGSGTYPPVRSHDGTVSPCECCACDPVWQCVPPDLSVPWNGGIDRGGAGMVRITDPTFSGVQNATTVSTPGGGGYITCYAGATYYVSVTGWPGVAPTDTFASVYGFHCPVSAPPGVTFYPWAVVRDGDTRLSCYLTEADADARAAELQATSRPPGDPYPPGSYPTKWGWINSVGIGSPGALPGISFDLGWYPDGAAGGHPVRLSAGGLWTPSYTADYWGAVSAVNDVNHNSYQWQSEIVVTYVSGPDPRFVALPRCQNGEPSIGQQASEGPLTGDGTTTAFTTTYPFMPDSLTVFVNGLDWSKNILFTTPTTGDYTMIYPFPTGSTVHVVSRRAS